jgi:threonine synthase
MRNLRLKHLRCITCEAVYPLDDYPTGCPSCQQIGQPSSLEAVYQGLPTSVEPSGSGYKWGHWLPYIDGLTLGEGNTPCLDLSKLAKALGVERMSAKHEGMNPTGSHKDRMSVQAIARAKDVGANTVVLASSGNAAISAAAYCAASGLKCEVATYSHVPEPFVRALQQLGATRVAFGSGADRWLHVRRRVEQDGAFPITNYSVPAVGSQTYGVEGYRAIALELVADGCRPDHIFVPTARGDLLWGLYSGLRDLHAQGLLKRIPALWVVEPFARLSLVLQGAPVHGDFSGSTNQFSVAGNTVTRQQLIAARDSGGGAVVVDDAQATWGVKRLAEQGLWVELCAGACVGGLSSLLSQGRITPSEHVLLLLTAKGDRDTFSSSTQT